MKKKISWLLMAAFCLTLGVSACSKPSGEADAARGAELHNKMMGGEQLTDAEKDELKEINKRDMQRMKKK